MLKIKCEGYSVILKLRTLLVYVTAFTIDEALLGDCDLRTGVNCQYSLLLELRSSSKVNLKYVKQGRQYTHNVTFSCVLVFSVSMKAE
jgi:hypothetical protein